MKIIADRATTTEVSFTHNFDFSEGHGYSFPCTEEGEVLTMSDCARKNYMACLAGENGTKDRGIERREHTHTSPAIGLCEECGEEVMLDRFTNPCECGADYNMSGQLLAPREQWGERDGRKL